MGNQKRAAASQGSSKRAANQNSSSSADDEVSGREEGMFFDPRRAYVVSFVSLSVCVFCDYDRDTNNFMLWYDLQLCSYCVQNSMVWKAYIDRTPLVCFGYKCRGIVDSKYPSMPENAVYPVYSYRLSGIAQDACVAWI